MNLWIRLLWTLLTVGWRGRVDLFSTSSLAMRVLPNDLDFNGHVNNGRYFALADLGRLDFIIRCGSARAAMAARARPIVADAMGKFRHPLRLFERYQLETRLLGWDTKWTFLEHRFVRRGRVVGIVVMRGLFLSRTGPLTPSQLLAAMNREVHSPALPDWLIAWSQNCDQLGNVVRDQDVRNPNGA